MMKTVFPPTPPPGVGIGFEPAKYRYPSRRLRSCTAEKHASNWIWNQQILATHTFSPVPQSSLTSSEYWPHSGLHTFLISAAASNLLISIYLPYCSKSGAKISWIRGCVCSTLAQKYSLTFWRSWEAKRTWAKVEAFERSRPIRRSCPLLLEEEYRCESRPGALRSDEYSEARAPSGGTEDLRVEYQWDLKKIQKDSIKFGYLSI